MTNNETAALIFLIAGCCVVVGIIANVFLKLRASRKDSGVAEALQSLEQRFARVEVALDDVTGELHRLSEGHGFLTRLLSERPRDANMIDRH
ncbi:MAG TPA: hypothetical protein VNW46_15515 [Gemmatimonadaceae bacterium]|jgi:hypothetical protein|nr:hypothetical protein [Gemmatimonadaceae bacterium]